MVHRQTIKQLAYKFKLPMLVFVVQVVPTPVRGKE